MLLRAGVMLQMIAAIGAGLGEDRIGAEPLAQRHVQLLAVGKAAMGAVMHQDRKPELARADHATASTKVNGLGQIATIAIEPKISAHA